jgi:PPOX class probable F420-dependent enzyme
VRAKAAVVHAMHRLYGRAVHAQAHTVTDCGPDGTIDTLDGAHYCLVVSYRRDGTPVPTPVWFGVDPGRIYFRGEAGSGKLKRIRANPFVRVARCDARGRPSAPPLDGTARLLPADEAARAERIIQRNYGRARRVYERWLTLAEGAYVEITPTQRPSSTV